MTTEDNYNINFTPHAVQRLSERTQLYEVDLRKILAKNTIISLGIELNTNRESKLFFSKIDGKFFVAVHDIENDYVITILTLEYWHNLSKKHFLEKRAVTKKNLLDAIRIADPLNQVISNPPVLDNKVFETSIVLNNDQNLNGGSIGIKELLSEPTDKIAEIYSNKVRIKLNSRSLNEGDILAFKWGLKDEGKIKELCFNSSVGYLDFINSVKQDLFFRNSLFKKYDDFFEVLNRRNNINSL